VAGLREADVDADPLRQFRRWFDEARAAGIPVPESAALATATPHGEPSVRMVLLKNVDERGLSFVTSYRSRKGRELESNPRAALLVYWQALGRQVRVEGAVEPASGDESDAYWSSRPAMSRVSAAASPQSEVLADRAALEQLVADLRRRQGDEPSRPATWGGYRLEPASWEFWQHRDDRLHDRLRYRRDGEAWVLERLGP
jgi:pyridoxamine 5'-phosphate oxidase